MGQVVEVGDKLHVMTRRTFEEDIRRHFVGEVVAVEGSIVSVRGFTFIFQAGANEFRRLPEERTRIVALSASGQIVNKLPGGVDPEKVVYKTMNNRLVITDGGGFSLPINEFGPAR